MEDYHSETPQQLKDRLAIVAESVMETRRLTPQLRREQAALIDELNAERIDALEYADRYWEIELLIRSADQYDRAYEAGRLLELSDNAEQVATTELMIKRLDLMNRAYHGYPNLTGHE